MLAFGWLFRKTPAEVEDLSSFWQPCKGKVHNINRGLQDCRRAKGIVTLLLT